MTIRSRRSGFAGDLEALSVVDLAQTLNLSGKTARVTLLSAERTGTMWFRDGAMTHATAGLLSGDPAMYALVAWTTGRFEVEDGALSDCRSVTGDTTQLLLEGLRRMDEGGDPAPSRGPDLPVAPGPRLVLGIAAVAALVGAIVAALAHDARPEPAVRSPEVVAARHELAGPHAPEPAAPTAKPPAEANPLPKVRKAIARK